jgi:hypothetical protein
MNCLGNSCLHYIPHTNILPIHIAYKHTYILKNKKRMRTQKSTVITVISRPLYKHTYFLKNTHRMRTPKVDRYLRSRIQMKGTPGGTEMAKNIRRQRKTRRLRLERENIHVCVCVCSYSVTDPGPASHRHTHTYTYMHT